jgi:hypothetical protein
LVVVKGFAKNYPSSHSFVAQGFLKKQFERISNPFVFIFSCHGRSLGCARALFLKRNKLETQLFVP